MSHVGNILTMIIPEYRGMGIGGKLAERTFLFSREQGYEKISTYILADNASAIRYYESLGFVNVGIWRDQVLLDGHYHDDVIVEKFL
jgi:RimJ/RimL family protein N-acetyltransferase